MSMSPILLDKIAKQIIQGQMGKKEKNRVTAEKDLALLTGGRMPGFLVPLTAYRHPNGDCRDDASHDLT